MKWKIYQLENFSTYVVTDNNQLVLADYVDIILKTPRKVTYPVSHTDLRMRKFRNEDWYYIHSPTLKCDPDVNSFKVIFEGSTLDEVNVFTKELRLKQIVLAELLK